MNLSKSIQFQLRYRSLFHHGRGYAFPCDARGQVELDALSEGARNNYYYAHAMVGKEMMPPVVEPLDGLCCCVSKIGLRTKIAT